MTLKERYHKEIASKLKTELGVDNVMAVPRVVSIVLNAGLGAGLKEAKFLETVESTLKRITGQKPVKTKARKLRRCGRAM